MLKQIQFQNAFHQILVLGFLQASLGLVAFIAESFAGRFVLNLTFVAQLGVLIMTLNFHHRALRNLLNTFWSISVALGLFYVISLGRNSLVNDNPVTAFWYFSALVTLFIVCWKVSSPLYYPVTQWWEYDFRFRPDLRVWVEVDGAQYRARLSDLRRGAGCVVMFPQLNPGTHLIIRTDILRQQFGLQAKISSRKEPILGRAFTYGISFETLDLEQKQRLKQLTNFWRESKKFKIRSKFATQDQNEWTT
jgi:hypothetical protein